MEALKTKARLGGVFTMEHWRNGVLLATVRTKNLIVNEGLNRILDSTLHDDALAAWFVALFEDDHSVAAGDDYETPGYTESTAYDEGTRPAYVEAAASSQSTTNSANKAVFTISGTKTIYGASLVSVAAKGDSTPGADNDLMCAGKFSASRAVVDDDVLNVTYTISAADDGV